MPGFISGLRRSVQKNELQGKRPAVTKGTAGRFIILGTGWGRLPQPARSADSPIYSPNRNSKKWFRFGGEEGGCGYGAFAAPAEAEWSRLLFSLVKPKGNPPQWLPFGAEEGGCGYGAFAAPAETEWSRLLFSFVKPKGNPTQWLPFGAEEGGCGYGAFAAPAEAEWSRLLFSLVKPKGNPTQWLPFGAEEGGCGYGAFAAPAEAEWSRLLLTQRAVCCAWRLSGGSPSACEECAEMSGEGCRRFRGGRAGGRSPVGRYPAQSGGGWHLERAFCLRSRVGR